jgi:hypothetical protein
VDRRERPVVMRSTGCILAGMDERFGDILVVQIGEREREPKNGM